MKQKIVIFCALLALNFSSLVTAQQNAEDQKLKSQREKVSYIIGLNAGNFLKQQNYDFDLKSLFMAIEDVLTGKNQKLTEQEIQVVMTKFKKDMWEELGRKNRAEGIEFLRKNRTRKEVVERKSGLQYEILRAGTGAKPKISDSVVVHYKGMLLNGKEFNSSYGGGEPLSFPLNGVIPGWSEALQLMKKGAKWRLYIPSNLAYREYGAKNMIGPNTTLIFEIELLDIK